MLQKILKKYKKSQKILKKQKKIFFLFFRFSNKFYYEMAQNIIRNTRSLEKP